MHFTTGPLQHSLSDIHITTRTFQQVLYNTQFETCTLKHTFYNMHFTTLVFQMLEGKRQQDTVLNSSISVANRCSHTTPSNIAGNKKTRTDKLINSRNER